MIMNQMKWISRSLVGVACIGIVACGGREVKPEPRQQLSSPLGQVQSSEGNVDIQTQKQVVITEKSEIPTVRTVEVKGDLNRMEEKHFEALGLSPDLSKNIVNYRKDHNGFKSVDELKQVQGMDDQNFTRLRDKLAASRTS